MIEIAALIAMLGLAFLASLAWGLHRYRRDKSRASGMESLAARWKGRAALEVVREIGDPFEVAEGTSGRSLYIWKAPPATTLPGGSGLLTVIVTVESGNVVDVEWRDHAL